MAIWGWVLPGLLIGLNGNKNENKSISTSQRKTSKSSKSELLPASSYLMGALASLIGLLVSLPSQIADVNFANAIHDKNKDALIRTALTFPLDSNRLSSSSMLLLRSNLADEALPLAEKAIKFNPNDYNSWIAYINNPKIDASQKKLAEAKLAKIDPLDTRWLKP